MDQNQDSPLFGLTIDHISKAHLAEAAKWAKFLAIVGFVVCGLIVLVGVFFGSFLSAMGGNRYGNNYDNDMMSGLSGIIAAMYILIAVLYFFPCLFLYYFSTKMKGALLANDQNILNASFQNLKKMFRYVGILTIIVLSFYALMLIIGILGATASSF
jgi:uncharacterized membrane protein